MFGIFTDPMRYVVIVKNALMRDPGKQARRIILRNSHMLAMKADCH